MSRVNIRTLESGTWSPGLREAQGKGGTMQYYEYSDYEYRGLPAAPSIEQAILLAQLLILRDLERRAPRLTDPQDREEDCEIRPAA